MARWVCLEGLLLVRRLSYRSNTLRATTIYDPSARVSIEECQAPVGVASTVHSTSQLISCGTRRRPSVFRLVWLFPTEALPLRSEFRFVFYRTRTISCSSPPTVGVRIGAKSLWCVLESTARFSTLFCLPQGNCKTGPRVLATRFWGPHSTRLRKQAAAADFTLASQALPEAIVSPM